MQSILKKYENLFSLNSELKNLGDSLFVGAPWLKLGESRENRKILFLIYAMAKASKTQLSILTLAERGLGQDAGVLTRVLFELSITTLYILDDKSEVRAKRFHDHDWVLRAYLYKKISDPKLAYSASLPDTPIQEIQKEALKIKAKYPGMRDDQWSDKSLESMAKSVDRSLRYAIAYRLQCLLAHPNARNIRNYFLEEKNRSITVDAGMNEEWVRESLILAFESLFDIVMAWNEYFNLGAERKLKILKNKHTKIS